MLTRCSWSVRAIRNSTFRLERFLALVLEAGAMPVVVLTKADLSENPGKLRREAERLRPGLVVETMDARDKMQTRVLDAWCRTGQTVAPPGLIGRGQVNIGQRDGRPWRTDQRNPRGRRQGASHDHVAIDAPPNGRRLADR